MDSDTSGSQPGRSSPKTKVLEPHSQAASDRPPSGITTGYTWTTPPVSSSVPRSIPAHPTSICRASVLGAFQPSGDGLTTNYELRSSPPYRHTSWGIALSGVQSGTTRYRHASESEQEPVYEDDFAQARVGSVRRWPLLPLRDDTATKDSVVSDIGASLYHSHVTPENGLPGSRGDKAYNGHVTAQQAPRNDTSSGLTRPLGSQHPQYSALANGVQHGPAKYDPFSIFTLKSALSDVDRGVQAHNQTQLVVGATEQDGVSQSRHSSPDTSFKAEIRRIVAFPSPVDAATQLTSVNSNAQLAYDVPASLDTTSHWTMDRQPREVTDPQFASMEVSRPDLPQVISGNCSPLEEISRDLPGLPQEDAGYYLVNTPRSSSSPSPKSQSVKSVLPRVASRNASQDEYVAASRQGTEPVQIPLEMLPCDSVTRLSPGSKHSSIDSPVSASPVTRPGLNTTGHHSELRTFSSSSTFSVPSTAFTDVSEATHSDDTSSETEHELGFVAIDSFIRQSITGLLARWVWNSTALDFHDLAQNVRKCPQQSGAGEASTTVRKRALTESSSQSNSSPSRVESGAESDQEGDDRPRRRRRKISKVSDTSTRSPRLLACPFYKLNPLRYSGLNHREREYRKCASGTWPDISRLKQHLYRVHRRPDFCCPTCYLTFEKKGHFDIHLRQRPACDGSEPKFQEKMTDEQMTEIKKKRSGVSTLECWNLIFTVLFPGTDVPESAYMDTPEREVERYLQDRFHREKARILFSLRQDHWMPCLLPDTDILDRMYQQCTQECTAVVTRLLTTGSCTATPELPDTGAAEAPTILEFDQPYDIFGPHDPLGYDLPLMHHTGLDYGCS